METPAGKECRYYYEDFHRGRNVQECRLIKGNPRSLPWHSSDCARCPVPEILNANASPNLELEVTVEKRLLGLGRKLTVQARCAKHHCEIEDARIGCAQCNAERGEALDIFRQALEGDND